MRNVYLLAFGYTDKWWGKWLKGYTHVALVAVQKGSVVGLEPLTTHCHLTVGGYAKFENWDVVLKVKVCPSRQNRLLKFQFQTCVTFVQYIMGISTGAILAQTLFDRLTTRYYEGIDVEVDEWVRTQSQAC